MFGMMSRPWDKSEYTEYYDLMRKAETLTNVTDPNSPDHGGGGGYGQFEYDPKTGVMTEMGEVGSGNWGNDSFIAPRSMKNFHDVTFYNDDLFLQIRKDTLNQGQLDKETGQKRFRGLVYERID